MKKKTGDLLKSNIQLILRNDELEKHNSNMASEIKNLTIELQHYKDALALKGE